MINLFIFRKGLAEWFSCKFTLYVQGFDYSTPYLYTNGQE